MKVILTRDVASVGKQGDIANVADGYARNYLFPRSLAIKADKGAMQALEARNALEKHRGEKHLTGAQGTAERLHNSTIVLEGKAAKGSTKLYGASGKVKRPGLWELPMGTPIREILEEHARALAPGRTFCALAPGAMEPLASALKLFREDFVDHVARKGCRWK